MAGKRKIAVKLSPEGPKSKRQASVAKVEVEMEEVEEVEVEEVEEVEVEEVEEAAIEPKSNNRKLKVEADEDEEGDSRFLGEAVPAEEARRRWPHRYQKDETKEIIQAKRHFLQAEVDGQVFFLEDDAFVKGEEGDDDYICKIIEFFEAVDGSQNFTAQWFYRARDTVIQKWGHLIDDKRVFFSEIKDENPLDCLLTKLNIKILPSKIEFDVKENLRAACDYYCDRKYLIPYSSFVSLQSENTSSGESGSTISSDADVEVGLSSTEGEGNEKSLLDLYSGCGAMSTGLCLGAESGGVKLVTKWAVDINEYACKCLKLNHPETEVRNEAAEDFLSLLKEWEKLGSLLSGEDIKEEATDADSVVKDEEDDDPIDDDEIYEVEEILAICYGDLNKKGSSELHFKIRWKGYGPEEDTWEPKECLSSCQEKLKQFVSNGYKSKILPLPGTVDVICGGPPCQGISGHNRFRNKEAPLDDPKNKQLIVYMDIVEYLRPKFVLMENVVDILKFAGGYLGRYALGRLVSMGYQARIGMMAAGAYGLPQFRMRMFMWGALSTEKLPQYPLPTHKVIYRGVTPTEFESSNVCTDEACKTNVKKELYLEDAISDLPPVENDEDRDEMPYDLEPKTEFQRLIRLRRDEMSGCSKSEESKQMLYDHRPLRLNQDDYDRVIQIPKKKGANFRDLPGVRVRHDNKVEFDPDIKRVLLKSGKPLVPDYAMSFVKGLSSKPFGRLWWDETVSTVVTRAEPHNQVILHPNQDRVLTIRENARLQGFPDYYKLVGPIKERYIQVGNAVAVPVARALGYSLAKALRGLSEDDPVFTLPDDYLLTKYVSEPAIVEMQ